MFIHVYLGVELQDNLCLFFHKTLKQLTPEATIWVHKNDNGVLVFFMTFTCGALKDKECSKNRHIEYNLR